MRVRSTGSRAPRAAAHGQGRALGYVLYLGPFLPWHREDSSHSCTRTCSRCTSLGLGIGEFEHRTTPHGPGDIEHTGNTRQLVEVHQYDDDAVHMNGV
jgi:hypothetical protein